MVCLEHFLQLGSLLGKDSFVMTRDSVATLRIPWFQALRCWGPPWSMEPQCHLCDFSATTAILPVVRDTKTTLSSAEEAVRTSGIPSGSPCAPTHDCYFAFWVLVSFTLLHYLVLCSSDSYFSATCSVSGLQWDTLITIWKTRGISLEIQLSSIQSLLIVCLC